jgi:hypothetical protein
MQYILENIYRHKYHTRQQLVLHQNQLTTVKRTVILLTSLTHRHRKANMKNFVIGTIFGLILATVGFSGIARMLDKGVDTVKTHSQEMAK